MLHGDTAISSRGLDTYGSRSLVVGGAAVVNASQKVIAKARKVAAHLLEASEDDLEYTGGIVLRARHARAPGISIQEIALATFAAHN